ncbi:uncharacterized protein LOC142498013 [Ascaphus truei]|uniref:uncharacterized protein LOC142498013 n=1 Tax=Ascaphus truei TaxID=8439 RepID=UPI003F59183F
MWDTIVIGVNACGNHVRDKRNCHKRFDDIRSKLKKKIQHQRVHATGTGGGPTPQRLILSPLEELLRAKLLPVVVEGLPGDRDIGIYPSQFPPVAPEGHVSPETEQVSSPGSASSTHLEEHDEEDFDDDDDDDAAAAIDTQIQASDHEEVPIETVLPPKRPANTTYDAIVASEGKIVEAENRRHSDLMTVLERMIALQEETVSQLAHLHRVFIEVPKQLQKINTSFEALVVQQTQANYWRMTNVPQFNTSQPGSVHAGQFSPHSSDIHSPGPNVTGQVADIAVQVPDDILPLPSVQIQQQTPTKEATKTKQDTHETDQPSLVQCLPTCSHVSVGTSPVREQSLPKSPVGESLAKSPVGESLPKSPVGESLPKSPVGDSVYIVTEINNASCAQSQLLFEQVCEKEMQLLMLLYMHMQIRFQLHHLRLLHRKHQQAEGTPQAIQVHQKDAILSRNSQVSGCINPKARESVSSKLDFAEEVTDSAEDTSDTDDQTEERVLVFTAGSKEPADPPDDPPGLAGCP